MRNVGVVVAQVVIALFLTGVIAPALLAAMPSLVERGTGKWAIFACVGVIFLLVRLIWPRRQA